MFINMSMNEIYNVDFEIYMEDKLVQRQNIQAPKEILILNFIQTMEQISRDKRPMRIRMPVSITIWDKFEKKEKVLNNEAEFKNNAMIVWEEERQERGE